MSEAPKKVKVTKPPAGFAEFKDKIGTLSGTKGVSGKTELVNFDSRGGLFLSEDQYELVT